MLDVVTIHEVFTDVCGAPTGIAAWTAKGKLAVFAFIPEMKIHREAVLKSDSDVVISFYMVAEQHTRLNRAYITDIYKAGILKADKAYLNDIWDNR